MTFTYYMLCQFALSSEITTHTSTRSFPHNKKTRGSLAHITRQRPVTVTQTTNPLSNDSYGEFSPGALCLTWFRTFLASKDPSPPLSKRFLIGHVTADLDCFSTTSATVRRIPPQTERNTPTEQMYSEMASDAPPSRDSSQTEHRQSARDEWRL